MRTFLLILALMVVSPVAFAGHVDLMKNYPNIKKDVDWGELSAARAQCLRELVDWKITQDQMLGEIRDFGNVREAEMCAPDLFKEYSAHRTSKKGR